MCCLAPSLMFIRLSSTVQTQLLRDDTAHDGLDRFHELVIKTESHRQSPTDMATGYSDGAAPQLTVSLHRRVYRFV